MNELTVDGIIEIHTNVLSAGEDDRILSETNLHQLVFLIAREDDPVLRASLGAFYPVAYPPFREGNVRTACRMTRGILEADGYRLEGEERDLFALLQGVKDLNADIEDVRNWIEGNISKYG